MPPSEDHCAWCGRHPTVATISTEERKFSLCRACKQSCDDAAFEEPLFRKDLPQRPSRWDIIGED